MKEYELIWEIFNKCPRNQMRDVFVEELELEDPEEYIRNKFKGKEAVSYTHLSPCRRFWKNWKNRGFELSERVFMRIWKPCVILEWIYITEEDGKADIMRKNPLQIKQKRIIR